MKKFLLIVSIVLGVFINLKAQDTLYFQNFDSSLTNTPAGWHLQNSIYDSSNYGWQFKNTYWYGNLLFWWPADGSYFAFVDDNDYNNDAEHNYDTLYSSGFSTMGYTNLYCSIDIFYWDIGERATLIASADGGHSWTNIGTFPAVTVWTTETYNLTAFANKPNVMLGITYTDNGTWAWGLAVDNIVVFPPLKYDISVTKQNLPLWLQKGTPYTFSGILHNYGLDSIRAFTMNYSVNGGTPVTDNISSMMLEADSNYNWSHNVPWTPASTGSYTVKFWGTRLNLTDTDQNHSNDTLTANFEVIDSVQAKQVLYEEFSQSECIDCFYAAPHLNAVMRTVTHSGICNPVRYHVNWPGKDYMNDETQDSVVAARTALYNIQDVPDAEMDGNTYSYPGTVSVSQIQNEAKSGSPFKVIISSATYNSITNQYNVTATIKSFATFASGLTAQAVITVDTILYTADYGDPSTGQFAPPIGVSTIPDSLYPGVTNFPNVAEEMMPSSGGTSLAAFSPGGTQNLSFSWVKNHPWSYNPNVYTYDSLLPGEHITIFIQTPVLIPSFGIRENYVLQSASKPVSVVTGIQELGDGIYSELYPNPTTGEFTIEGLTEGQVLQIYDYTGKIIRSIRVDNATMRLNILGQANGLYLIRILSNTGELISQKKIVKTQ